MEPALKSRMIGAFVLVAVAVIVVPMLFPGAPPNAGNKKSMSLNIPAAPSSRMRSQTLAVGPQSTSSSAASTSASDRLATVDVASHQPPSVQPGQSAESSGPPSAATARPSTTAPDKHPVAPSQAAPKPAQRPTPKPATPSRKAVSRTRAPAPGRAARADYTLNLGAYGERANAQRLMRRVVKLGYPVKVDATHIAGKPAARVTAGPFHSRAAAEAARLKIKGAVHGVPAKLVAGATDQHANAPATAIPAHRAGDWAVQLGAFSHKPDAEKLRDRARAAGFDSYLDDVKSAGKTLWRVRVGPQTQRSDAVKTQAALKSKLKLKGVIVTTS